MKQPCRAAPSPFTTSIWDRLTAPVHTPAPAAQTLHQSKAAITRDLENLLNTRTAIDDAALDGLPLCRRSIAHFGLADFAELSLSSSTDKKALCERLEGAIGRHEPRLAQVRARLVQAPGTVNRLCFVITARLRLPDEVAPVRFDVMFEPSSLHYSIR